MVTIADSMGADDTFRHFSAVPQFGDPPRYAFYMELGKELSDEQLQGVAARLDRALCEENVEYETRRDSRPELAIEIIRVLARRIRSLNEPLAAGPGQETRPGVA